MSKMSDCWCGGYENTAGYMHAADCPSPRDIQLLQEENAQLKASLKEANKEIEAWKEIGENLSYWADSMIPAESRKGNLFPSLKAAITSVRDKLGMEKLYK